ncbi:hypothetical protein RJT34_08867 [Clitoria ternatea]|uniref:Uncharacterized protein n=1 Tax=Clitoria ternatea TaxID=43366 RepID=A0AAN9K698_CLITE
MSNYTYSFSPQFYFTSFKFLFLFLFLFLSFPPYNQRVCLHSSSSRRWNLAYYLQSSVVGKERIFLTTATTFLKTTFEG